jgi:hypothetical protein
MITRPKPLPDELDRGYLGRVMRLNGFRTEKECVAELSAWSGLSGLHERSVPIATLLSRVSGLETQAFVQRHTTLPFRRGITSYMPTLTHGCESNDTILRNSGMRLARPGAYFCRECAEADQVFHGVSYWRREHQIPGALCCSKHGSPLSYVEDEQAFLKAPAAFFKQCHTVDYGLAEASQASSAVCRYLEICAGLLDRAAPLDVKDVVRVLAGRARSLGLQTWGGKAAGPLLSDLVADTLDSSWLGVVLPDLVTKSRGELLNRLDGVLYLRTAASSTVAYVLAASVLFDSADEALSALQSAVRDAPSRRNLAPDRPSDEALREAYVATGGGHAAVAKFLNANYGAVSPRLETMGLPKLLSRGKDGTRVALRAFLLEGRSMSESASIGGISELELASAVRTACVSFVPTLEQIEAQATTATRRSFLRTRQIPPHQVASLTYRQLPDQRERPDSPGCRADTAIANSALAGCK